MWPALMLAGAGTTWERCIQSAPRHPTCHHLGQDWPWALKLGHKPHHTSPKPHQQQCTGCHVPSHSAKAQHLLGMSSLKRSSSTNHLSPFCRMARGLCDTMHQSSLQGLKQCLQGRPVQEAALVSVGLVNRARARASTDTGHISQKQTNK